MKFVIFIFSCTPTERNSKSRDRLRPDQTDNQAVIEGVGCQSLYRFGHSLISFHFTFCKKTSRCIYSLVSNTRHTGIRDTANFERSWLFQVLIIHNDIYGPFQGQWKHPSKFHQDMLESKKVMTMQKFTRSQFLRKTPWLVFKTKE